MIEQISLHRSLSWLLVLFALAIGGTARAVTFNFTYNSAASTPPGNLNDNNGLITDPSGTVLMGMLDDAGEMWGDIILDNWTINVELRWQVPTDSNGNTFPNASAFMQQFANHPGNLDLMGNPIEAAEQNGRVVWALLQFNPNRNWWADPTPFDHSEFDMAQTLYRDLTPAQQTSYNAEPDMPPNLLEVGFSGMPSVSAPAPMTVGNTSSANNISSRDLLTYALHELGHTVGIDGSNAASLEIGTDGDYDIDDNFVAGIDFSVNASSLTDGHITDAGTFTNPEAALMVTDNLCCARRLPSAIDVFAGAAPANWTNIRLERTDFLTGNTWDVDGNWEGDRIPGTSVDAFIRHGGLVSFSANDIVTNLVVDEGSLLAINDQSTLGVLDTLRVGGSAGPTTILSINFNGEVDAELANIAEDGRINLSDSTSMLQVEELVIDPDGELRGEGIVDINDINGMLTSGGVIRSTAGELRIDSNNTLALALGGEVFAVDGDIRFQTGFAEPMTAQMTIGDGREIIFESGAAVGDGGRINLMGDILSLAQISGSLLFLNDGAVVRADGVGNIQNTIFLEPGSMIDTEAGDPNSLISLSGSTRFQGGQIQGDGIVIQNGDAIVSEDTLIAINTYDMDGTAKDTVITINLGSMLDVDSPHIDTDGINFFHGVIDVKGGMLDIETNWTLVGDLNLTQTEGAGAALLGEGGMLIQGFGELNVSGFAGIGTDVTVAGTVFVDGEANFNGNTSILATADLETNGANDEIDFNGPVTLAGGSYTGAGVIKFDDQVTVTANTSVGMSLADLDGDTAATVIDVRPNVTFSVASTTIDPIDDAFDAEMNLQGTFSTIVPFNLEGLLNMIESSGDPPPTLNGLTGFTVSAGGVVNTDGDTVINRDTTVQGGLHIGQGTTQINAETTFESTANVSVADGGTLELNGPTTYEGGSHTGLGLIQFNGMTNINDDTTIGSARVDLDGAAENTVLNLNDSRLTLNVKQVDTTSVQYNGLANVVGENAQLAVNLNGPSNAWRLMSDGQLNFSNPSPTAPTVVMLSGSPLSAEGVINAVGPLILAADVEVKNLLNVNTAQSHVHFGGPTRSTIHANRTATVVGLGQITVDNGTTLSLEDQSMVAVDTTNRGRLEIGFEASEVSVDYTVPATATIRGFFAQTLIGELAVDLRGTVQASRYDWLQVIGMARLSGTVEATFIDDFVPDIGDVFTILTATSGRDGEFDIVEAIDENGVLGFVLTDLYTATEAMLRVDDVFLIGDYNGDGMVNIADYPVWRNMVGAIGQGLAADGNGDEVVDHLDYDFWAAHFGNKFPAPGAGAAVPEPSGAFSMVLALVLCKFFYCCSGTSPETRAREQKGVELLNN